MERTGKESFDKGQAPKDPNWSPSGDGGKGSTIQIIPKEKPKQKIKIKEKEPSHFKKWKDAHNLKRRKQYIELLFKYMKKKSCSFLCTNGKRIYLGNWSDEDFLLPENLQEVIRKVQVI